MTQQTGAPWRLVLGAALAAWAASLPAPAAATEAAPGTAAEIIGYYPGWKSDSYPVNPANVDASKMSVLLYAFLDVCWGGSHGNPDASVNDVAPCQDAAGAVKSANGALVLRDAAADGANLRALVALKKQHPKFKVMVSVGGWNWSNQFSNVAASKDGRAAFIASSVALMRRYGLDGVDIDWEYPGGAGVPCTAGQVCDRPGDKQNFVTLARELRRAFDRAGKADRKHYGITIAAGGNANYVDGDVAGLAWLAQLSASLDWINIMAYDYHMPWEQRSGHHAGLLADPADPVVASGFYGAASVQRYLRAGVPAAKLVLGLPFYGYGWKACAPGPDGDGQYQPCGGPANGGNGGGASYGFGHMLKQGLLTLDAEGASAGAQGYTRYWNAAARAPYLYNAAQQVWISYEDPASLKEKARYIRAQGLRGAMFWELSADSEHQLLGTLAEQLKH